MIVGSVQRSGTSLPPGKELVAAPGASSAPRRPIRSQTFPPFLQDGNDFRNEVRTRRKGVKSCNMSLITLTPWWDGETLTDRIPRCLVSGHEPGRRRRFIFNTDGQRHYFLALLGEVYTRYRAEIHAYCLMGNHDHLFARPRPISSGLGVM